MEMQEMIALGLLWYTAFLLSTTCHEAAHALVAKWGGDLTAYAGGQVTLNPAPHIQREPFGMVLMPWLSFLLGGGSWMMGWASAPYDPYWARRHPRRSGWMALGGPAANFILVIVAGLVIQAGLRSGLFLLPGSLSMSRLVEANGGIAAGFATFFSILFSLNLLLGTFNLIPFPPLDGFSVLNIVLPLYFKRKRKVPPPRLREFATTYFGPYGGYAQQYLFHHARTTWRGRGKG